MGMRRPASELALTVVVGCLLVLAVCWAAPGRVVDADALSRLAMGRLLSEGGALPGHDPFTFAAPDVRFGDPEWLGDLGFYAVFSGFGESGLQAAAIGCACVGYLLSLMLGRRLGGQPLSLLFMLLSSLPVAAPRISPRNDVHLFWLFPLLGLLGLRALESRRAWFGLMLLGVLWANLHSSFLVAWMFLIGLLWLAPPSSRRIGLGVVLAYPVLPLLGAGGMSSYAQLFDHVRGAGVYRALLSEWQSPLTSSGWLAILPLYVWSALGVAALMTERETRRRLDEERAQWQRGQKGEDLGSARGVDAEGVQSRSLVVERAWLVGMFVVGCVLAFASRRFLPALAYLIVPAIGGSLHPAAARLGRARWPLVAELGLALAGYLVLAARSGSARERESVFARAHGPDGAIAFLKAHAPPGSRVANAFNDGPWLLWFGEGRFQHYLDPRNNLGADILDRYVHEVLADDAAFAHEAERLDIQLALVPQRDPSMQRVHAYLAGARRWRLVYWDGTYALFARDQPRNDALIDRYAYRVLKPTLDLRYLSSAAHESDALARDLSQLDTQSRAYAQVLRAYVQLRDAGGAGPRAEEAAKVIAAAWPALPDTTELTRALTALPQPAQESAAPAR